MTDAAKQARRAEWDLYECNARMMELLEESGGEVTPEVEALELRIAEDVDALALLGASVHAHADDMLDLVIPAREAALSQRRAYYRRLKGWAKGILRKAAAAKGGVSKFEAGTYAVSFRKPAEKLLGGPAVRSDGWVDAPSKEAILLADLGLAKHGVKPDRTALLVALKSGKDDSTTELIKSLDYVVGRPAEKTVSVK